MCLCGAAWEVDAAGGGPGLDVCCCAVHFKGSYNGKIFDESREMGEPYEFTVGQAKLKGFDEMVQSMAVGETKEVLHLPTPWPRLHLAATRASDIPLDAS